MNKSAVLWYLGVQSQDVSGSLQGLHTPWKKKRKKKNFVVRALKTKQVFSLRGCQINPILVKYLNGGR